MATKDWGLTQQDKEVIEWRRSKGKDIPTPWGGYTRDEHVLQVIYLSSPVQDGFDQHPHQWIVNIFGGYHTKKGEWAKEKFFKTKSQALTYAKSYMRKH